MKGSNIKSYNAFGIAPLGDMPLYLIIEYKLFLFQFKYHRSFSLGFNAFINHFFKDLKELNLKERDFLNVMYYLKKLKRIKITHTKNSKFVSYDLVEQRYKIWLNLGKAVKETVEPKQKKPRVEPELTEEQLREYELLLQKFEDSP